MSDSRESCSCLSCQSACTFKPGWFLPGEAERAAELMGMNVAEFFRTYLGVDWWSDDDEAPEAFVLAPAITDMDPGEEYPRDPKGTCVFFRDGGCQIHAAKPYECRHSYHTDTKEEIHARHIEVALAWGEHQGQIKDLLGREPETKGSWSIFDEMGLGSFFGGWYDDYEDDDE